MSGKCGFHTINPILDLKESEKKVILKMYEKICEGSFVKRR